MYMHQVQLINKFFQVFFCVVVVVVEDHPSSTCFRWQFRPPTHRWPRKHSSGNLNEGPLISLHSLKGLVVFAFSYIFLFGGR